MGIIPLYLHVMMERLFEYCKGRNFRMFFDKNFRVCQFLEQISRNS